jgi:hypothetical protein
MQLKTSATMPLRVKPSGRGLGGARSPLRLSRSTVLPAALPLMGMLRFAQASRWFCGILSDFWSSSGASTNVAARPEMMCHSSQGQYREERNHIE